MATSKRITRTAQHHYNGDLDTVMDLLTAGGERKWIPGWDPTMIYSENELGAAPGTIFMTNFNDDGIESTWYCRAFDRENGRIEYLRFAPGLALVELEIDLKPNNGGTDTSIAYTFTSLGGEGDAYVSKHGGDEHFGQMLSRWEVAVNKYLAGEKTDAGVQ